MATVTMSATLKVGDNDTPIQIGDIKPITESDVDENNLVIFYNGSYYGSDGFVCTHFEGVTINFNVRNDKDEEPKLVKTGVFAMDNPPSGNYVQIKCGEKTKFYDVSEVAEPQQVELNFNGDNNGQESDKLFEQRDAAETDKNNTLQKQSQSLVKNAFAGVLNKLKTPEDKTNDDKFLTKIGGKRSRKTSRKSGRKPSRKAYRKSVGNKKRNRGTRKK